MTDRWQTYTRVALSEEILTMLSSFCDEFLIHGVDVEGKRSGIEQELIGLLGRWNRIPITYAGGIRSLEDIEQIRKAGQNKIHVTVGSALDLYGGDLPFEKCWRRVNSNDVEAQFTCAICKIPSWMLPAVLQEEIGKISNWGLTF